MQKRWIITILMSLLAGFLAALWRRLVLDPTGTSGSVLAFPIILVMLPLCSAFVIIGLFATDRRGIVATTEKNHGGKAQPFRTALGRRPTNRRMVLSPTSLVVYEDTFLGALDRHDLVFLNAETPELSDMPVRVSAFE